MCAHILPVEDVGISESVKGSVSQSAISCLSLFTFHAFALSDIVNHQASTSFQFLPPTLSFQPVILLSLYYFAF